MVQFQSEYGHLNLQRRFRCHDSNDDDEDDDDDDDDEDNRDDNANSPQTHGGSVGG